MASESPDLISPSQPQSVTALRPIPSYYAWWQRHTAGLTNPKGQWHSTCKLLTRMSHNMVNKKQH